MISKMADNKRVIMVGEIPGFTMPHIRAFETLGFECIAFDNRANIYYSSQIVRRIIRTFPRLVIIKKLVNDRTNKKLISLVKKYKPFLVFTIKAENIYPETIAKIKNMGAKTACFYIDYIDLWPIIRESAPVYDYYFSQCHVVLNRLWGELGLKNCFYMAHSSEPTPENEMIKKKKYDISFIGTHDNKSYINREKYLMSIKDLGLNIWGTDGWSRSPMAKCFHGRSLGDQRFEIYKQSKIVVDIKCDSIPLDGLGNRPFEVTGCGTFFMTDCPGEDIERSYRENKEIVSFKNGDDLREKVIYYLNHEKEREEIARAGYNRTVAEHTYIHRVRQLLDTMEHPEKYLYK